MKKSPKNKAPVSHHKEPVNSKWAVLLADSSPIQRMLIGRMLTRAGYEVVMVEDGRQALQKIQQGVYYLLLTSWEMPNVDGIGLCRAIRSMSLPYYTYTILLTSRDSSEHVVMGLQAGADDYLTKPIIEPEILARLNTGKRLIEMEQALRQATEENRYLAYSHPLTGIPNHRYLVEQLPQEIEKAIAGKYPISFIMCDIDFFKFVNDTHGHPAGGDALVAVAKFLYKHAKDYGGWAVHHGGDEFAIVLPNRSISSAVVIAESIRFSLCEEMIQLENAKIQITASFGVSGWEQEVPQNVSLDKLIRVADEGVYDSKSAGRNRVSIKTMLNT